MRHLFAVAVFAIAVPAIAVDQDSFRLSTGADLAELCSASADHSLQPNALGLCHGFLEGAYQYYEATEPASSRSVCYHRGLDIQDRYHFGFYDSLIIAAALEAGCTRLLTEHLQDGHMVETLTVTNPFKKT